MHERASRQEWSFLPHMLTTGNLLSGAASLYFALRGDIPLAALLIYLGMVLDVLDGFVAQRLGIATAFGIEYDSLADFLTFGIAPAFLAYTTVLAPLNSWGWVSSAAYITATALRLARFNAYGLQQGQGEKHYFQGIPSPAAAGTLAAWVVLVPGNPSLVVRVLLGGLALGLGLLMVSRLPFPHLQLLYRRGTERLGPLALFLLALVGLLMLVQPWPVLAALFSGYALHGLGRGLIAMARRGRPA